MHLNRKKPAHNKRVRLPALGRMLLFGMLAAGCSHKIDTGKIVTTRDIIRFLIRDNPGIFSNSFLDTSRATVAGTDFSFSRNFTIKSLDTAITLNDLDTVDQGGTPAVVPRAPRDAGAEIIDTLVGQFRIDSAGSSRTKPYRLPVAKFGYFQKLQSDAFANRGWYPMGATQTFVGVARILDSVQIRGRTSGRDTVIVRQNRNMTLDPLNDRQVFKVRTNPFQLKPNDSVEVRVWAKTSTFGIVYLYCYINDLSSIRRIQLAETAPGTGEFFGAFRLSDEPGLNYNFRRLIVDAITQATLSGSSTFQNEIWGIIYQLYP